MSRKLKERIDRLRAAESGAVVKPRGAEVSVALAYPNRYFVGMANLGVHQIYSILNQRSDTVCERVFLPDDEDRPEYAASGTALFSLETRRPVRDFDVLAFSVSFEQDYVNVIEMLRLAGIEPQRRARTDADPLLLLGGVCAFFNPEPLADFFDAVIVGEGEDIIGEVVEVFLRTRDSGRRATLRALARLPGVYIPEFYELDYHPDGTIRERRAVEPGLPERIRKRTVHDISARPAATVIATPNSEFGGMHLAEMTRGCGRHCRFCMAGYLYLPPRALSLAAAKEQAAAADQSCGKIGLVGAALSDYAGIDEVCGAVQGSLSVSSLRADSVGRTLIDRLARSGHKTISIAPEAGSERLRKVINKGVTEDDILRAADLIFGAGIPNLKLYFIIGLPTETAEDIDAVIDLAVKTHEVQLRHARPRGSIGRLTLSVNSFVPKPFTPFQWEPMESVDSLKKKLRRLAAAARRIGNTTLIHDLPKWEYIQALLSRGDRRLGPLLLAVQARSGDWKAAAASLGIDMDFYVRRKRGFDEILPWDFIDIGVGKDYLMNEYRRGLEGRFTPPCRVGACTACGVCGRENGDF